MFGQMQEMREKMYAADGGDGGGGTNGGGGSDEGSDEGSEDEGGEEEGASGGEGKKDGKKQKKESFTQSEVNAISRKEKAKAKAALLKSLFGTDDADEVAELSEKVKKFIAGEVDEDDEPKKGKKSESKDTKALEKAIKERQKAENKAAKIQFKLDAIEKGVKPKFINDFSDLAFAKIQGGADADEVVDELIEKYPFMVDKASDDEEDDETETEIKKGTGKTGGQKKAEKGAKGTGFATRLLEKQKNSGNEQGDFFKNNF